MVTGRPPSSATPRWPWPPSTSVRDPPAPREHQPGRPPHLGSHHLEVSWPSRPESTATPPATIYVDLLRFREGRAVGAVAPPMMSPPSMGTTQAVPYGAAQTLHQIAAGEPDEPERSRTGLYAGILVVLLVALGVVVLFLGQSLGWWHVGSGNTAVTVNDVAGLPVLKAEQNLHSSGLKTHVVPDANSTAPDTEVIRTDPVKGTKEEGLFKATFDPRRPTVAPAREEVPPHLNFAPMQNAVESLTRSAKHYQQAMAEKQASLGDDAVAAKLVTLNKKLIESERRLTNADGLPRRPWYKHLLYAPGVYTGYGVKTVPGVREGIEQKRYAEADQEIVRVSKALEDESTLIESAARELESLGR